MKPQVQGAAAAAVADLAWLGKASDGGAKAKLRGDSIGPTVGGDVTFGLPTKRSPALGGRGALNIYGSSEESVGSFRSESQGWSPAKGKAVDS